jgi:dihydroorotate dehydrogenase
MSTYKSLIRPLLFSMDPETAHEFVMEAGKIARISVIRKLIQSIYDIKDARLEVSLAGLKFPNPVGLAAGIDKNCRTVDLLSALGPGSIEIGVISAKPQPGNEKPRIYRFPEQRSLINRMGNPNIGADAAKINIENTRARCSDLPPIGLNIGKTTATPIEDAPKDCAYTLKTLGELVDYIIINVSCPNVADYSKLQEKTALASLLSELNAANSHNRPIFVKLSPDLAGTQGDDAIEVCLEQKVAGIIATNTTLSRDGLPPGAPALGGMSGATLYQKSLATVKNLATKLQGRLPLIGVGGISSAADVKEMLGAGASVVELYTALVYEGPGLLKRIKSELLVGAR